MARVAVDVSLSHLDRFFDYAVQADQDAAAVPGARVRVRFSGRLCDGFVVERLAGTEHDGQLAPLQRVVSAEPVLTRQTVRLVRAVADHYAGCFADVLRLAVPPRHAASEQAPSGPVWTPGDTPETSPAQTTSAQTTSAQTTSALHHYPTGPHYLTALSRGGNPRAAWLVNPCAEASGDWADGLAAAAAATAASARGSVLVVPDLRDLERLRAACATRLGPAGFAVLTADLGPAARYRAFLAGLRGRVGVVIGTRAAAFAPVQNLGLVALFDDGDDLLADPRAPYPHAREVLALRATQAGAAALFAGYGRTTEILQWVERGWLRDLAATRGDVRRAAPRVGVAADAESVPVRDPAGRGARLPSDVFTTVRAALAAGPVLVQVPRAGYLVALVCDCCRAAARCAQCGGPVSRPGAAAEALTCGWCGQDVTGWSCPTCGGRRYRAPVVGARRTAEELGKAFPSVRVRSSVAGSVLTEVDAEPALVVATPGAEPRVSDGYAAAILLDTAALLLRADLRAGEEALRRWLNAVALVRGGERGGTVLAVGDGSARPVQALVRLDPDGFAARELGDRIAARFPPAIKLVTVEGAEAALAKFRQLLSPPGPAEVLGPVPVGRAVGDPGLHRLTLRAPLDSGAALVKAVKVVQSLRSTRKSEGALRVRVDPVTVC